MSEKVDAGRNEHIVANGQHVGLWTEVAQPADAAPHFCTLCALRQAVERGPLDGLGEGVCLSEQLHCHISSVGEARAHLALSLLSVAPDENPLGQRCQRQRPGKVDPRQEA